MPLPNGKIGVKDNPLIKSPFVQHWDGEGSNPPPPTKYLMKTETGVLMVTEITDYFMSTE